MTIPAIPYYMEITGVLDPGTFQVANTQNDRIFPRGET